MARHCAGTLAFICLATLVCVAVASADFTAYLPFVSRMPTAIAPISRIDIPP